jgi:hypothetical protein
VALPVKILSPPRRLQSGKLQVGVLVVGRDPRIADFHGPILSLISGTAKPLIDQGHAGVSEILICGAAEEKAETLTDSHLFVYKTVLLSSYCHIVL